MSAQTNFPVNPPTGAPPLDEQRLQALLETLFAPWVRELGLQVDGLRTDGVALRLPVQATQVHSGGVLCGQALMAAADTALVLAASHVLGGFRPMTTVQLQTSFMRPIPGDAAFAAIEAVILRRGRTLLFGEARICLPDGSLAAHVTSTTALI